MIDRLYALILLLIAAVMLGADLIGVVAPLVIILGLAWLALVAFEQLAMIFAPELQRDLIAFRSNPKSAALDIVRTLDLERPHPHPVLAEKAQDLALAATAVTLRHPNPLYGPVRLDILQLALHPHLPRTNMAFIGELTRAWVGPVPGMTTLGGLWLLVRRTLGAVLFPGSAEDIDGPAVAWWYYQQMPDRPQPANDHMKGTLVEAKVLFDTRSTLALQAGFDQATVQTGLLPFRSQRLLHAAAAILSGDPRQERIARILNPTHRTFLAMVAEAPEDLPAAPAAPAAPVAPPVAAPPPAPNNRGAGGLTPEEITDLIADRAQDSILLNRLWPPGAAVTTNSWLGGLPCLPPDMDWPRSAETDLPQHFLAQVDCADLPTLNGTSPLPRNGLLLFFSDLDEERLEANHSVLFVPHSRQSVPPRALPDDLPEIDHQGGQPNSLTDNPGLRSFPRWPVLPTAVKIWGGQETAEPKTRDRDYLRLSRAAHDASLAAVMPPPVASEPLGSIFTSRHRKDADGNTILTPEGKAIPYTIFDPTALPDGFPFCGTGIDAFVTRLQQQATRAARRAASERSLIDAKWNDTEEKRARKRAEADQADARAQATAALATDARAVLGTLPALGPVPQERVTRLHGWLSGLLDQPRNLMGNLQTAVSDSLLDLARSAVTDPALAAILPDRVFAAHATSLLPSPRHAQHLMLGPAQTKTNSTAMSGIRLLCLDSDYGPGMMYCDGGVLEYWISPEDLAARRFDRVRAETAGG